MIVVPIVVWSLKLSKIWLNKIFIASFSSLGSPQNCCWICWPLFNSGSCVIIQSSVSWLVIMTSQLTLIICKRPLSWAQLSCLLSMGNASTAILLTYIHVVCVFSNSLCSISLYIFRHSMFFQWNNKTFISFTILSKNCWYSSMSFIKSDECCQGSMWGLQKK